MLTHYGNTKNENKAIFFNSYKWGVGRSSGKDDVVNFQQYNYTKESCTDVKLSHNTTYYSTVIAYNKALNEKSVNVTSTGGR